MFVFVFYLPLLSSFGFRPLFSSSSFLFIFIFCCFGFRSTSDRCSSTYLTVVRPPLGHYWPLSGQSPPPLGLYSPVSSHYSATVVWPLLGHCSTATVWSLFGHYSLPILLAVSSEIHLSLVSRLPQFPWEFSLRPPNGGFSAKLQSLSFFSFLRYCMTCRYSWNGWASSVITKSSQSCIFWGLWWSSRLLLRRSRM